MTIPSSVALGAGNQPDDLMRKFRLGVRPSRSREDGARSFRVGLNFGYWPCLGGPFVQIYTGFWAIGLWWGTASYLTGNGHEGI